jgi:hypothetical protein
MTGSVSLQSSKGMPKIGGWDASNTEEDDADENDDMDATFNGIGSGSQNGVSAMVTVDAVINDGTAHVDNALVEAHVHYQSGPVDKPTVVVQGIAKFVYPCMAGTYITANATVAIDMTAFQMNSSAVLTIPCVRAKGEPVARLHIEIDTLTIEVFDSMEITDVVIDAAVYKKSTGYSLTGSITASTSFIQDAASALNNKVFSSANSSGAASTGVLADAKNKVNYLFDTHLMSFIPLSFSVHFEIGPLDLHISMDTSASCEM